MKEVTSGIHTFKDHNGRAAYFIPRKYGNYLIFNFDFTLQDYEFLKSKGGVWRQLSLSSMDLTEISLRIFNRFGAYNVLPMSINRDFKNEFGPIEILNKDFFDDEIQILKIDEDNYWLILKQREKYYLLPTNLLEVRGKLIFLKENYKFNEETVEQIDNYAQLPIEAILFSRFKSFDPFFQTNGKPLGELFKALT